MHQSDSPAGALRLVVACAVAALALACERSHGAPPTTILRFANVLPGSFSEQIAQEYSRVIPEIEIQILRDRGAEAALDAVARAAADVTLSTADMVYFAYRGRSGQSEGPPAALRALAVLGATPLHLVVQRDRSRNGALDLRQAVIGTANAPLFELVIDALGLSGTMRRRDIMDSEALAAAFTARAVDAALFLQYAPSERVHTVTRGGGRLVAIEGAAIEAMRRRYRFIRPVVIPRNTYVGQEDAVPTVGAEVVFVCRRDLDEGLVYELTKALFRALPKLAEGIPELQLIDVGQAPATPIPLHPGAARYYRELELMR